MNKLNENKGEPEVMLFTDGACSGNPGPGGWAFVLRHVKTGKTLKDSGAEENTTNNRMELKALIEGLKRMKRKARVHIVTDSSYVENGITKWIHNWKRNNWKRRVQNTWEPVKNEELWKELDALVNQHDVTFERVRGHSGHPENEICDKLAVKAYKKLKKRKPAKSKSKMT